MTLTKHVDLSCEDEREDCVSLNICRSRIDPLAFVTLSMNSVCVFCQKIQRSHDFLIACSREFIVMLRAFRCWRLSASAAMAILCAQAINGIVTVSPSPFELRLVAAAWATDVIASQETQIGGVVAEIIQCRRKDNVLTIHMKLRNITDKIIKFDALEFQGYSYDDYYIMGGQRKYKILRDAENVPLAPGPRNPFGGLEIELGPGGSWTWWAKYPAPPSDVRVLSYYTPLTLPFDDVPITD